MGEQVKPWWIWEGAAVRFDDDGRDAVGTVSGMHKDGVGISGWAWFRNDILNQVTPIENPAVTLAPEWARIVDITEHGYCVYFADTLGNQETELHDFTWPQCPDHLKGTTQELPR